ncbi:rho-associated protein kinase 1-like [Argopecten irradians]|uniref:rho-associated protein kinase 1-like n=1 Tax=Argopecten irradians TaxID=31199 RepID=UPI0037118EAB
MKETIATIQRELHEVRNEHGKAVNDLEQKIEKLYKEKETALKRREKTRTEMDELVKLVDKLKSEHQKEIDTLQELSNKSRTELKDTRSMCHDLQKKIENLNKQLTSVKNDVKQTRESASDFRNIASRYDDKQACGITSAKKALKVVTERVTNHIKSYESEMDETHDSIKACVSSVTFLKKQLDKLKKLERSAVDNGKTPPMDPMKTCNRFGVLDNGMPPDIHETLETLSEIPFHAAQQSRTITEPYRPKSHTRIVVNNDTNSPRKTVEIQNANIARSKSDINGSTGTKPHEIRQSSDVVSDVGTIPVHFPSSMCQTMSERSKTLVSESQTSRHSGADLADKFVGYRSSKRKVSRFYIHGMNRKVASESAMRDFLDKAGVRVTH